MKQPRLTAFLALAMLFGCNQGSMRSAAEDDRPDTLKLPGPVGLEAEVSDTLQGTALSGLISPVWITQARTGRYLAVDQSDRDIKTYDDDGRATASVGGPGIEEGRFRQLLGGGLLRDSIFGYDFANQHLTVFSTDGSPVRALQLPVPPSAPMPATVRAVDDSLLLVVGFAAGAHDRPLLRLIQPTGKENSRLFDRSGFYESLGARLVQRTGVLADARDGVVYAGLLGGDSLFAFDYSGRQIAAGAISGADGQSIPSFRTLMLRNGGRAEAADGRLVMDGAMALLSIVAVDRHHVVLQVAPLRLSNASELDPFAGGTAIVLSRSPFSTSLITEAHLTIDGALVGRDHAGRPLLARYLTNDGAAVELLRLLLIPRQEDNALGRTQ